jgi:hypothetical protein
MEGKYLIIIKEKFNITIGSILEISIYLCPRNSQKRKMKGYIKFYTLLFFPAVWRWIAGLFNRTSLVISNYFVERERERERDSTWRHLLARIIKINHLNNASNLFFQENFLIFPSGIIPAGTSLRAGTP